MDKSFAQDIAGIATEYLARLGQRKDWQPYIHQMESWIAPPK